MKGIWNESELKLLDELLTSDEKEFLNREINQKIRSIPIYDDINAL